MKAGYKQTDMGVIPEDWEVKKLSELTSLITNGFVGTVKSQYTDSDDGILYIQGYNVEENAFNFRGIKRVTVEFHKQHLKSCLQEGDLLTIQTGDVGLTTIVPKELEGSNCHALIISRFKKAKSNPKYFSLYLNSNQGRAKLKEIEIGTTMKHINVGDMIHFLVPFPPKTEQTAIATALSDTDALISSLEKLIAKKRNVKQGAMQTLLQPKEGWEVKTIDKEIDLITGFPFPSSGYSESGIKLLRGSNVKRGVTDWSEGITQYWEKLTLELKPYILENGDIVIAMDGSLVGKSFARLSKNDLPALLLQRVARIRSNKIDLGYLKEFICSEYFTKYCDTVKTSSAIPHISPKDIRGFSIPIPPTKAEQTKIATTLSDMDTEITALETKLAKLKNIKLGMMQNLLTGKIRLTT